MSKHLMLSLVCGLAASLGCSGSSTPQKATTMDGDDRLLAEEAAPEADGKAAASEEVAPEADGKATASEEYPPEAIAVARKIRGEYLPGIKRCHQRLLKVDPGARGKLLIEFTVGPTGSITEAKVSGFSSTVDECIASQSSSWRFDVPIKDGKPTSADFRIPMFLSPGA